LKASVVTGQVHQKTLALIIRTLSFAPGSPRSGFLKSQSASPELPRT